MTSLPTASPLVSDQNADALETGGRDHIFVSYAWEDAALAEWLARKLAAEGYAVWMDRLKLLGGERWPKDIDTAIKARSFRMVALLSRASIDKPNPAKERQLALALGREREEADFLIPLNVDGLKPTDLDWQLSDINWIPFERWGDGLGQLLEKLAAINTPRALGGAGAAAALATFRPANVLRDEQEPVLSNCLPVVYIPDIVHRYAFSRTLLQSERHALLRRWAFDGPRQGPVFAFTAPPAGALESCAPECVVTNVGGACWREVRDIDGIRSSSIVRSLVRQSLMTHCSSRGLVFAQDDQYAFFPDGLLPNAKLRFRNYTGDITSILVAGERKFGLTRFRYQLGLSFWVRYDVIPEALLRDHLVVETKIVLHITDPGQERKLEGRAINARRKKVAKGWWNHEWLSRQLALAQYLAAGSTEIVIGGIPTEQVRIAATALGTSVSPAINDAELRVFSAKVEALEAVLGISAAEEMSEPEDKLVAVGSEGSDTSMASVA